MPNTTPTSAARTVELYQFQGGGLVPLLVRCSAGDVADIEAMIAAAIAAHNTDPEAHPDIRQALKEAGGGLVTAPVLTLAERLPIGAAATLGMAAQAGLVGAHVARFDVTVNDAEPVSVEAVDGAAEYAFTPAGNEGDTVSVRVVATDNFGNRSREATARGVLYEKSDMLLASTNTTLLSSVDNGISWETRTSGAYYNALTKTSDGNLLAYTTTKSIIRSTDKGTTWSTQYTDSSNFLNGFIALADGLVFCTPNSDYLLRSVDNGVTWNKVNLTWTGSHMSILPLDDGGLLAVQRTGSAKHYAYHSSDQGASWTIRSTWTPGENDASFGKTLRADDGSIVTAGYTGAVRSTDNGVSWKTTLLSDWKDYSSFNDIFVKFPSGDLYLFILANRSVNTVYRSTDHGVSWEITHALDAILFPNSFAYGSDGDIFIGDDTGHVHHSTNNGASWKTYTVSEASIRSLLYIA